MGAKVICAGAANLAAKRIFGPFWFTRRWLRKTQWLSKEELRQIQRELLQRMVEHCYRTVPYYRDMMEKRKIKPTDIKTLSDIEKFPVMTRQHARRAGKALVSTRYPRLIRRKAYTGGTTGMPLDITRDLFSISNEHAFVRRQWDWAGIGLCDRTAYLTGRIVAEPDKEGPGIYAYDPLMNELIFSTYHLNKARGQEYGRLLKYNKVKALVAYPSSAHFLARVCLEYDIEVKLRAVLTSSETLTDSMRQIITEAFGCPVYDFYGGAERVCYIHTCPHGSYHVIPEYGLTEYIPDKRGYHRIIATGFWNKAMPFIRYDTGDLVKLSEDRCDCGREFPVVSEILGRKAELIRTPSGRELGAAVLTHLLYGTGNILESQIIQDRIDHLRIEYVPTKRFSLANLHALQMLIGKHLPSELKVDLHKVRSVRKTASGKIEPLINRLNETQND